MQIKHVMPMVAGVLLLAGCSNDAGAPDDAKPSSPESDQGTAAQQLAELTVATEDGTGYDRDLFPHWSDQGNGCDTRETVLQRDGDGVEVDSECYPTAGSWYSVYDGATGTDPSDVDIDHLVPLAETWASGASAWSTDEREAFANDLTRPQLIAITDDVNQDKSDQATS